MTQDFTLFSEETPWDILSFDIQTALGAPSCQTKLAVGHEHASFHPLGTVAFTLKPVFLLLKNDLMQMYLETEKDISLCGPLLKSHKMSQIVSSMLPNMPRWLECYYFLSQPVTGNRKEMDVTSSA